MNENASIRYLNSLATAVVAAKAMDDDAFLLPVARLYWQSLRSLDVPLNPQERALARAFRAAERAQGTTAYQALHNIANSLFIAWARQIV